METLDHSFLSSEAEPVATEVERLEYEREFEEEKREEEMLKERFSKAVELRSWQENFELALLPYKAPQ